MKNFRELQVWRKAHELTLDLYRITAPFPREELFGLTRQLRRASSAIPANLAEGCGKSTDPEFRRYCSIAMGSASELEYHLILAHDLGYLSPDDYQQNIERTIEIKKMLATLIKKLG